MKEDVCLTKVELQMGQLTFAATVTVKIRDASQKRVNIIQCSHV